MEWMFWNSIQINLLVFVYFNSVSCSVYIKTIPPFAELLRKLLFAFYYTNTERRLISAKIVSPLSYHV